MQLSTFFYYRLRHIKKEANNYYYQYLEHM